MKKVTDLKENEVIVCRSEQEAKQIRQLMHDAGLKWCTGESYLERYLNYNEICYYPYTGSCILLKDLKNHNRIIHEAKDFIIEEKDQESEQPNTITLPLVNGVPDISNCGVEMFVSDNNEVWVKETVYAFNDKLYLKYISKGIDGCVKWKHVKPLPKKITRQEAEKLLNNEFEIVD